MENIRVVVRVRPFLSAEGLHQCVTVNDTQIMVGDERQFAFDEVFDMDATSARVNESVAAPLVEAYVNGYTASTIAYGQTGAGKTYTMSRLSADVARRVYAALRASPSAEEGARPELRFSAVEVYNENISDLIGTATPSASQSLPLREDARCGVYIQGLSEIVVDGEDELLAWIKKSTANRHTASTLINETSSRSHCLLTMTLTHNGTVSRFGLVDLAGSERIKKTHGHRFTTGNIDDVDDERHVTLGSGRSSTSNLKGAGVASRMREGISINSGLLSLGNVIVALCERKAHVPYRTSKLTRLLQPMLSGNSKTTMIACVSPDALSFEETLNTLKYADRAKSIRTTPFQVAARYSTTEDAENTILCLRQQLEDAQRQLQVQQTLSTFKFPTSRSSTWEELEMQLASERNLTRRLQEDLFNAEYTAMVVEEKRKQLEQRLLALEAKQQGSTEMEGANAAKPLVEVVTEEEQDEASAKQSLLLQLEAERDELCAQKRQSEADAVRLAQLDEAAQKVESGSSSSGTGAGACGESGGVADDASLREKISREIESKEGLIRQLVQQNEEAARALEHSKQQQAEMLEVKRRLEEELACAEVKLEATEMARQNKEEERRKLQAHYQQRLRKAEEAAAEYRRKVQEAASLVTASGANAEVIKHLQAQVLELSEELNRQHYVVREGQKRVQKMAASHLQEMSHLQKQMRETEAQVARLHVQLQKKEREIARVKSGNASRRHPAAHPPQPPAEQSITRQADAQEEIDVELLALASLEKELDGLTAYQGELKKTLTDTQGCTGGMPRWKKAKKGFSMRLRRLEQELQSEGLDEARRSQCVREKVSVEEKLTRLETLEPIFARAKKQLAELDDTIDSLQEARKYHLRRARRLQKGTVTSVGGNGRALELLRRELDSGGSSTTGATKRHV
ncbi:kinesin [Trypanosoma grayi]|uniref:kinesin n=1 Tax=Trypanosoma grayi TaxID=71804 RepID=UPI0004F3FC61|nr:kinesin [Trypanosoma grayi]KEG12928.1 kinesin [Trypanosoma grayi]